MSEPGRFKVRQDGHFLGCLCEKCEYERPPDAPLHRVERPEIHKGDRLEITDWPDGPKRVRVKRITRNPEGDGLVAEVEPEETS